MPLSYGVFLPPFDELAEPGAVVEIAVAAEQAGWDGLFLWDHVVAIPGMAVADSFTVAAAVAQATERIRVGMMVTPLARRRPWVLARQTATLDRLSGGRLVVGAGLGDDGWGELGSFDGEPTDPRARADLLDESLELLRLFWSGETVAYEGKRLVVHSGRFLPTPVQDPLPVWVACIWPHRRPLDRAARQQGCFPLLPQGTPPLLPDPADVAEVRAELLARGASEDIDIVCRGATGLVPEAVRAPALQALEEAGMTWWLDSYGPGEPAAEVLDCIRRGPPVS
jgi:alkanesulfonate monooxygenase SsuD/methylene tetrahydromethanopterin reductase-like flavin-dependent oxidoreductase (luciferase family)